MTAGDRGGRPVLVEPAGLFLAALFFAAALTPSLAPRAPLLQGVLSGVLAGVGYILGSLLVLLWRSVELPRPGPVVHRWLRIAGTAGAVGTALFALNRAAAWQNATRRVFDLPPVESSHPFTVAGVTLAVFVVIWALLHGFGLIRRRLSATAERVLPRKLGQALGFGLALWVVWALADGVLGRRIFDAADASFEAADIFVAPDQPAPTDPGKTGGPGSLLRWDELGRMGRRFIATAPTQGQIAAFAGPGAQEPIRVYVGRRAAETPRERAEIALAELIRQGGFQRKALVVMVPVGTGWMDPAGQDTLDYVTGGDVATVAVQYSYLTSALALWAHPEAGVDQARELFNLVYDHWTQLPQDARPEFYVHGLSQGAFNSQATLPILDLLADPIDGAMWTGSPFFSPYWRLARENRNPGSPAWRPLAGNGSLVRTMNQFGGLEGDFAPWGPIRMVFLNYGSDAIVVFNPASAWQPPDWMARPRAPDVAPELRWFPLVTTVQLGLDMTISLNVPGFGHSYVARDYIDAWAATLDPEGWTDARAEALKAIFAGRPVEEGE